MLFMQSDGGLTPMDAFSGSRAILSGPAGGVVCKNVFMYIIIHCMGRSKTPHMLDIAVSVLCRYYTQSL